MIVKSRCVIAFVLFGSLAIYSGAASHAVDRPSITLTKVDCSSWPKVRLSVPGYGEITCELNDQDRLASNR